jgi:DNA-3-methyladenine glycosylase I
MSKAEIDPSSFPSQLAEEKSGITGSKVIKKRCEWSDSSELMRSYHDTEWGVPVHDDGKLLEFLLLDGAQAGLSWSTILRRRKGYREAFDGFDALKIAGYTEADTSRLLGDSKIIRNRRKIESAIGNARAFLNVCERFGSFDRYIWRFVNGRPIRNTWKTLADIPASTSESRAMSKELQQMGFSFVGPTICYAFMQAAGLVNDHLVDCFRYEEITG